MAEKISEGRRMSRNILSDNACGEEGCINSNKTGGRKSGEKPQIELYRPQTGMTLRRADNQLWRNSNSSIPCPVDSFNKNCQVNQVHGKSKNFNKKFESRNNTELLNRSEQNINKNNNENEADGRNMNVSVENGGDEVIDLTTRSADEKKKIRKPEKAIYVPKPILQTEKEERIHHRKQKSEMIPRKSEEDIWDENPKNTGNDRKKKKKSGGRGRQREGKDSEEKEYSQSYKEDNSRRLFENSTVQKQVSLESGRFQREQKNEKRNFNNKRHDDKRRDNNKPLRKSSDALDFGSRADSPEFAKSQQNFKTDKRDFRQNSEPRIIPHTSNVRSNINNTNNSNSNINCNTSTTNNNNNNSNPNNRLRDTRSMEHSNWGSTKIQSKPPAGRRGSGTVPISKQATFDSLPPRLKKKYMEEKGITMNLPPNSYIGTSSEDAWDGGSLSFSNNSSSTYMVQQYQMPSSNYQQHFQNYPPQQWPQKSSSPKGRGRGRLRQDENDKEQILDKGEHLEYRSPTGSRCTTPFKNVSQSQENISHERPLPNSNNLPPRSFSSHDQVGPFEDRYYDYDLPSNVRSQRDGRKNHYDGRGSQWKESKTLPRRNQYGRNSYLEKHPRTRKLSNASTVSNNDLDVRDIKKISEPHLDYAVPAPEVNPAPPTKCISPRTLDWGEEVEESERQEREAMSRSSSVASLSNIHSSRDRRKQKRRGNKKDRSLSRDSGRGYRNSSQERFRNQRRQSDENIYRPSSRDQNKGHYGFHKNLSRESSREREPKGEILDWRRGGDQEKNDKDWRRGDAEKSDKDWRREKEKLREDEKDEQNSWREEKKKEGLVSYDSSVSLPNMMPMPGYQQGGFIHLQQPPTSQQPQRQLFDPSNPSKPIIVNSLNSRVTNSASHGYQEQPQKYISPQYPPYHFQNGDGVPSVCHKDRSSNRPSWYDHTNESFRRHRNRILLLDIERADTDLQYILRYSKGPMLLNQWQRINFIRQFLQLSLQVLLVTEIKFCKEENVEHHMWKITFYNLIETLRNSIIEDPENKERYKNALLAIYDDGIKYFEGLIQILEEHYEFKVETFLASSGGSPKGLGVVGLALLSTQKIMIFLGDLARYRDMANDSNNYGKSKQWYTKAQQLNPKNGRPYYQLAFVAYLSRRKLDAVYYYMRSLMASNPLQSAKESLVSLFDENRKKYEQIEKKKREERESKYKERVKEKEGSSLRREIWVHPSGRRRVHRTTSTSTDSRRADSEDEELLSLESTDINKRFTTSYLHVLGKLFTKVGMETFQDAGLQMLREFRALLQQTPLPLGYTRFLQLLALNMFAIENTQLKDTNLEPGYRSAVQESALIISLQMFNLILEKCVALLCEQFDNPTELKNRLVGDDVQVLLPAIKVWCDWLLCHVNVWNPPPNCSEYRVGPAGDAWNRLAFLVNLLEKLDHRKTTLETSDNEGLEVVRLPEDEALAGFTPLMLNEQHQIYTSSKNDMELAQCCLRIRKILFVGTVFLCETEPPVLKLQEYDEYSEYISVVDSSGHSQSTPTEDQSDADLVVESFSEEECEDQQRNNGDDKTVKVEPPLSLDSLEMVTSVSAVETRRLLIRKEELEKKHQRQERHRKRVQAILQQSGISVVIEVKPKYLVPDTNCFIDYLELLKKIASSCAPSMEPYYILTIPLIVLNELEGLARGGRDRDLSHLSLTEQEHAADVSGSARTALTYLRSRSLPTIRCVTTKGKFLNSFTTFQVEDDIDRDLKNDDRVLATCISLCRNSGKEQVKPGDPKHLVREAVLLTEDRNLRVKALARDVPVREVPDFAQWAGLG